MTTSLLEGLIALLALGGALFVLIGSIGLIRMPDLYTRLHAPAKSTTLGTGSIVLAATLYFERPFALLILLFLFITAPVSTHIVAKAALHLGLKKKK